MDLVLNLKKEYFDEIKQGKKNRGVQAMYSLLEKENRREKF